mmetsp:Transcript_60601/g.195208  ORF Transcript_60601/g.195208 Transcript_60601/m.195208 type:complete len:261 (-) Transcript_60601:501-1283(-)
MPCTASLPPGGTTLTSRKCSCVSTTVASSHSPAGTSAKAERSRGSTMEKEACCWSLSRSMSLTLTSMPGANSSSRSDTSFSLTSSTCTMPRTLVSLTVRLARTRRPYLFTATTVAFSHSSAETFATADTQLGLNMVRPTLWLPCCTDTTLTLSPRPCMPATSCAKSPPRSPPRLPLVMTPSTGSPPSGSGRLTTTPPVRAPTTVPPSHSSLAARFWKLLRSTGVSWRVGDSSLTHTSSCLSLRAKRRSGPAVLGSVQAWR